MGISWKKIFQFFLGENVFPFFLFVCFKGRSGYQGLPRFPLCLTKQIRIWRVLQKVVSSLHTVGVYEEPGPKDRRRESGSSIFSIAGGSWETFDRPTCRDDTPKNIRQSTPVQTDGNRRKNTWSYIPYGSEEMGQNNDPLSSQAVFWWPTGTSHEGSPLHSQRCCSSCPQCTHLHFYTFLSSEPS